MRAATRSLPAATVTTVGRPAATCAGVQGCNLGYRVRGFARGHLRRRAELQLEIQGSGFSPRPPAPDTPGFVLVCPWLRESAWH